jgi:hypothetical protein
MIRMIQRTPFMTNCTVAPPPCTAPLPPLLPLEPMAPPDAIPPLEPGPVAMLPGLASDEGVLLDRPSAT